MNRNKQYTVSISRILVSLFFLLPLPFATSAKESKTSAFDSGLYLKVQLDSKLKISSLKRGDAVEGTLSSSVYAREKELLPAGSKVRLVVDALERRHRERSDHWPWLVQVFTPRHQNYPTFRSAQVLLSDGRTVNLKVSLLSMGMEGKAHADSAKVSHKWAPYRNADLTEVKAEDSRKQTAALTARFTAVPDAGDLVLPTPTTDQTPFPSRSSVIIPAGTHGKVILLEGVSASSNHVGDKIQARLVEPIYADSLVVLPEGMVLEGRIVKSQAPRTLSRSGSLFLSFTEVIDADGNALPAAASVAGVSLSAQSRTRIDPEGGLHGDHPGLRWTLLNLAATSGVAKAVDDGTQLVMEAIVASATDASTAGTSRIVSACISGIFMLTRHGRDVILPQYTEMEVVFDRPVVLSR